MSLKPEPIRGSGRNGEISNDPFPPVQQKGGYWTYFNMELQEILTLFTVFSEKPK
jgi:hypothetical protein